MILKKYNEAMDRIRITKEMRERLLAGLRLSAFLYGGIWLPQPVLSWFWPEPFG